MFIINNYTKQSFDSEKEYLKTILDNLTAIADFYFEDKPSFSSKDYELYYFDENVFETQANKTKKHTVYLELNPTNNIKIHQRKIRNRNENILDMYLTLDDIRKDLSELFLANFNSSVTVFLKEKSVLLREIVINNDKETEMFVEVVPCFKHLDKDDNFCVIYYDKKQKDITIKHTTKIIEEFNKKNKQTDGLLVKYTLIFKNLYKEKKLISDLPHEIIETLLFNVPNTMFEDLSLRTLANIVNFLRNKNLSDFKTIDGNTGAFTSKYSTLSYLYAKNFLKKMEHIVRRLF